MKGTIRIIASIFVVSIIIPAYAVKKKPRLKTHGGGVYFRPEEIKTLKDLDPYWKPLSEAPFPVVGIDGDGTITADRQELRKQLARAGAFYLHGDGVPMDKIGRRWAALLHAFRESGGVDLCRNGKLVVCDKTEEGYFPLREVSLKGRRPKRLEKIQRDYINALKRVARATAGLFADVYRVSHKTRTSWQKLDSYWDCYRSDYDFSPSFYNRYRHLGRDKKRSLGLPLRCIGDVEGKKDFVPSHPDRAFFTLLFRAPPMSGSDSLEVKVGGRWRNVPAIANTLLVLVGREGVEAMRGKVTAPLHRVVAPSENKRGRSARESMPCFFWLREG